MNCAHAQERVIDVGNGIRSLARLVDSCKPFLDFRLLSAFCTFVAKNSGGVNKKPMIILKEFFFSF